ncbi:hypothetical protein TSUD_253790 [Trifolium subterraneum]|uniref:RNA-directed DNA polymerase n=1 Tax=Trifolium subterraneum TaxID=3900 RepID=A0A2Z6NNH6_TRISU|nr:hypothetical protein TSUD_253790 [Trifolium subterraneum]
MPPRRNTQPKMGDRVQALETRMGTVDNTLAELVRQMQEHANLMQQHTTQMQQQSAILTRLSEQLGTKGGSSEGETSGNNTEQGESRLAGKKVKLPLFDVEDPVAWITRETMDDEGEIVKLEESNEESDEEVEAECKVLGVLGSMGEYRTMKVEGKLEGVDIVVLIDSGASHNFISPKLTSALGLTVTPMVERKIKLGDGHRVLTRGVCKGIKLKLGDMEVVVDALVLDLGGLDVILGVSWLCTLGKVIMDWKTLNMQFVHQGKSVVLQGQGENQEKQCYLNSFLDNNQHHNIEDGWINFQKSNCQQLEVIDGGLAEVLQRFADVFKESIQLPPMRSQSHQIKLFPDHGAVSVRPYRYPHHQKAEIERQVKELLEVGVIRPSMSAFSSPVILVKKKDSSWRICVDYRALNKATIPDKYPIPIVDELLDELFGATVFSKIDLKSGYHQIRVLEEDIHKTAFRTHNGHYEYLVMPFGLMNAPATFQSIMNDIFRPYLRKFVLVFFDDILIYSKDMTEHYKHLEQVLNILLSHSFVANQSKCNFGCEHVNYLGHIIYGKGVAVDADKIRCVLEWPSPKNVKGVRGFLGLTGYYRKFIKDYGKIAKPLTELTKKDNFLWGKEAAEAFEKLKLIMTTAPVLVLPNFDLPFEVECDAAGRGIGAVLMQNKQPIAFFSKALSEGNLAKSVYEKELMALVLSIQHWRHYLLGNKFVVYTDHKSLKHFLQQRISSPDQQCWLAKLLGYQFEVQYKPGPDNKAADALSRYHGDMEMNVLVSSSKWLGGQKSWMKRTQDAELELNVTVSSPKWLEGQKLLQEIAQDVQIQQLISELTENPNSKPGCFASDQPKSWAHWIPWAELWYNTTYHESIGKYPFEVVYGRSPPTLLRFLANETKVAAVALELAERDEALSQLKAQLLKAQQQMKLYADKKRRDVQFAVGEWVFLKLRPHRQRSVVKRINQKLSARFYGPFQIMARIEAVAYKLQLPEQSKIHPVFHVSLLKRAVGNYQVQGELPKELENNADDDIYPEKVLGSRVTLQNGVAIPQSLIQWKHKNADDVTWEDTAFIAGQFPDFKDSLEDKALFETGGIDGDMGLDVGEKPKLWRSLCRIRVRIGLHSNEFVLDRAALKCFIIFGQEMRSLGFSEVGHLMQNYAENYDYDFKAFQLQIMRFGELWKCR